MSRCVLAVLLTCWFFPLHSDAAEPLPADAQRLMDAHDKQVAEMQAAMEQQLKILREQTMKSLQEVQNRYTREARLDEAVAIRDQIRALQRGQDSANVTVMLSPGRLYEYRDYLNQPLYFQVTGELGGSVWGTDIYTGDSSLATAAVHVGAVEPGQTGVVKVTILPGLRSYAGTTRHNVTSTSYGSYAFSYKVEATQIPVRPLPMPVPQPMGLERLGYGTRLIVPGPVEFPGIPQ